MSTVCQFLRFDQQLRNSTKFMRVRFSIQSTVCQFLRRDEKLRSSKVHTRAFFHHQQFVQFLRFDQAQKFQRNPNTTSVCKHFFCSRWNLKNLLLVTVTWNIRRRIIAGLALSSCSSSSSAFPCLSHKLQVLIVVA